MGALAVNEVFDRHKDEIYSYLEGYWYENDIWELENRAFKDAMIETGGLTGILADFSTFRNKNLKAEMKFYLLNALKERVLSVSNVRKHYQEAIKDIGKNYTDNSFEGLSVKPATLMGKERSRLYEQMQRNAIRFFTDYYDDRPELEHDKWHARLIPGVKMSVASKRTIPSLCFEGIPAYYRESVKRYLKTLIYRRSWSFCCEILVYIRYFYETFYRHGYQDGFQEELSRADIEKYLQWVSEDYEKTNATFRSKAVSFIRNWLDFIQLAEYFVAPKKDITRLIFDEDIPKHCLVQQPLLLG